MSPSDPVLSELPPPVARVYRRNFRALVLYQIFMRVGWIFKTESTVIPGFVTAVTDNPLWISVTPMLSRFAQFLPPFLFLDRVQRARRQKPLLLVVLGGFVAAWGALAVLLWLGPRSSTFLLGTFFLLYGFGWLCVGVERLLQRILIGRLIPVRRRGRLFAISGPFGSFSALASGPIIALFLGRQEIFPRNFAFVFGMAFAFFAVTWLCALLLREPPNEAPAPRKQNLRELAKAGCRLLRRDANFRRIFIVEAIRSLAVYLFSYYVAYARTWSADPSFQADLGRTLGWGLTVQNLVIGSLSLVLGLLVDWKGNRLVLRALTTLGAGVPLLPVLIGHFVPLEARLWTFLVVYAFIGQLPVLARVVGNYILEIAPEEQHPLYVGIFTSGQVVTLIFPIGIGLAVRALETILPLGTAYELVFVVCSGILFLGAWLTIGLEEPRHRLEQRALESEVPPTP